MAFDSQPVLIGKRVRLQPLRRHDFDALFAVASDPELWAQHPARDRWRRDVFGAFFEDAIDSRGALAIVDRANEAIIGSSRYYGHDADAREIEIGWTFIARHYWGGVYNGEVKRLMLDHAFRFVDHVVFLIGPDNLRSQKAVEKLGATRIDNRERDGRVSVVYRISSQGA